MSGEENDGVPAEAEAQESITAREISDMGFEEYLEVPREKLRQFVAIHLNETNEILDRHQNPEPSELLSLSHVLEKQADLFLSHGTQLAQHLEPGRAPGAFSEAEDFYDEALERVEALEEFIASVDDDSQLVESGVVEDLEAIDGISDLTELIESRKTVLEEYRGEAQKQKLVQSGMRELAKGATETAVDKFEAARETRDSQNELTSSEEESQLTGLAEIARGNDKLRKRDPGSAANHFGQAYSQFPDSPDDSVINMEFSRMLVKQARCLHHFSQGIYYTRNSNYVIAIEEFDDAEDIAEELIEDVIGAENQDIPDATREFGQNIWRGVKKQAAARRLVAEGKSCREDQDYDEAIEKFRAAKAELDNSADNVSQTDVAALPDYGDMLRNYARETIPNLIEGAQKEQQRHEELTALREDYQDLQQQIVESVGVQDVDVDNAIHATSIAKANAEAINEIQPVVLDNVDQLIATLPDTELSGEKHEQLLEAAREVQGAANSPRTFVDRLKSLGTESKDILENHTSKVNHTANAMTILQFFANFA